MGRNGLNLGLVGLAVLCLAGCPSETSGDTDGEGDTDTDTDATATMTMTGTMTATMSSTTAMSASESATTEPMTTDQMTTDNMTTGDTDTDPSATDTDSTGDTGSTTTGGTGDACEMCLDDACGDVYDECAGDEDCDCWLQCFLEGNNYFECSMDCDGGKPPGGVGDYFDCIDGICIEECAADVYEPCSGFGMGNCMEDLECNGFIGYCSPDCTVEDCPKPATGDATPECSDFSDNCILPCDDGTTCPDGMDCNFVGGGSQLCTYGP